MQNTVKLSVAPEVLALNIPRPLINVLDVGSLASSPRQKIVLRVPMGGYVDYTVAVTCFV